MAGPIEASELRSRRERLLEQTPTGFVLFDDKYIQYFTGFNFLATERPVAVIGSPAGELLAFVPEFEVERTEEEASFDRVGSYPEYPGEVHPMVLLVRLLESLGMNGAVAA